MRPLLAWPSVALAVGGPAVVSLGFPSEERGGRNVLALRGKPPRRGARARFSGLSWRDCELLFVRSEQAPGT